jgi:hypothetical protein
MQSYVARSTKETLRIVRIAKIQVRRMENNPRTRAKTVIDGAQ